MFCNCSSLTTLNLSTFSTSITSNTINMFDGCDTNLLYCIINEDNDSHQKLVSELINNSFLNNNCSQLCFLKGRKYIYEKEICLINSYDYFDNPNIISTNIINKTTEVLSDINIVSSYFSSDLISPIISTEILYDNNIISSYISSDLISTIITTDINTISSYIQRDLITTIINNLDNSSQSLITDLNDFKKLCKINDNVTTKDDIIKRIRKELKNGKLNQLIEIIIEKQKDDLLVDEKDIKYQITSTYNQNNNEYINISTIKLGECESLLRLENEISNNITLLIFKIEILEEGLLIPIIEYEVYNSETKEKLNLDICKDITIDISIPVNIDENNLFKHNPSSEYYNDICYPYTTEQKTDITLNDRKKEFNEKNMSLCENNCEYNGYNYKTKKAICECYVKINFPLISEVSINKDKLIKQFYDFENTMNIYIVKCYKELFYKDYLIYYFYL